MSQTVISQIEQSIFALSEVERAALISRLTKTFRIRSGSDENIDAELDEMANDPDIQREIREIERDFQATTFWKKSKRQLAFVLNCERKIT